MSPPGGAIVAIATPPGRGGIGVVRISGGSSLPFARAICGCEPVAREATLAVFRDARGEILDRGLAIWFPAPHSFTGEDVLELHAHGSPVVLAGLLRRACELGARPARAGEFSERAFLNGKLDLAQAEAIADLIAAGSAAQARAALRSLEGEFSRRSEGVVAALVRLRVEVEAAIDFSEDASEGASEASLDHLFDVATQRLRELLAAARTGVRLTDGLHVVIAGAPNVGKSSLLNALAGSDRAMVTDIPGTTRDILREAIAVDGCELLLADTAGLREAGDALEAEGIRRARAELERADLVLWVVAADAPAGDTGELAALAPGSACLRIVNKIDLAGSPPARATSAGSTTLSLSARTGAGLDLLRDALREVVAGNDAEGAFSARTRHVVALERAAAHLACARAASTASTPEVAAEDLRAAQQALETITGAFTTEDLLGAIFATFCVGK